MNIKMISVEEIVSIPEWNASRMGLKPSSDFHCYYKDNEDRATLASKLFDGWNSQLGIMALVEVNESNRAAAESARETELALYDTKYIAKDSFTLSIGSGNKTDKVIVNAALVRNWAMGHLKHPKYIAITCNRRLNSLPVTNAARDMKGLPPILEIPCEIKEYAASDEKDFTLQRELDGLRENLDKDAGQWKMSVINILSAVWSLFVNGAREADLEKIGFFQGTSGRGRKQKYYLACRARQAMFNACKIAKRDPIDVFEWIEKGAISFAPFEGKDAKFLRDMLTKENDIIGGANPDIDGFESLIKGKVKVNEPRMASKESIVNVIATSQNDLVKVVLKGVTGNDMSKCAELNHLIPISGKLLTASKETIGFIQSILESNRQDAIAVLVSCDDSLYEKVKKALKLS